MVVEAARGRERGREGAVGEGGVEGEDDGGEDGEERVLEDRGGPRVARLGPERGRDGEDGRGDLEVGDVDALVRVRRRVRSGFVSCMSC